MLSTSHFNSHAFISAPRSPRWKVPQRKRARSRRGKCEGCQGVEVEAEDGVAEEEVRVVRRRGGNGEARRSLLR